MGKTNQLYQDAREARAEEYMKKHPDADPQDAYDYADRDLPHEAVKADLRRRIDDE